LLRQVLNLTPTIPEFLTFGLKLMPARRRIKGRAPLPFYIGSLARPF